MSAYSPASAAGRWRLTREKPALAAAFATVMRNVSACVEPSLAAMRSDRT